MSNRTLRVLSIVSLMLLGACGQRGDLYLPEQQKEEISAAQQPADTTTDDRDENTARRKTGN